MSVLTIEGKVGMVLFSLHGRKASSKTHAGEYLKKYAIFQGERSQTCQSIYCMIPVL